MVKTYVKVTFIFLIYIYFIYFILKKLTTHTSVLFINFNCLSILSVFIFNFYIYIVLSNSNSNIIIWKIEKLCIFFNFFIISSFNTITHFSLIYNIDKH